MSDRIFATNFGENNCTGCPKLNIIADTLYASGSEGIKYFDREAGKWKSYALTEYNVIDFVRSNNKLIATIVPVKFTDDDRDMRQVARLIKCDVGDLGVIDITPPEMEYTYRGEVFTTLSALTQNPADENDILLAGSQGIYRTFDFGEKWELFSELSPVLNPHFFLGFHPYKNSTVLIATESPIFSGVVYVSEDGGETWSYSEPDPYRESACLDVAFDPIDPNHLLVSGIYSIYESFDCGLTWAKTLDDDEDESILGYAYNIMFSPSENNSSVLYAVGRQNHENFINICASYDNGSNWSKFFSYVCGKEVSNIFDSIIYDGKLWIYDAKGIIYIELDDYNSTQELIDNSNFDVEYYTVGGVRLSARPQSGLYIEKRGSTVSKHLNF